MATVLVVSEQELQDGITLVSVRGEVDISTAPQLRRRIVDAVKAQSNWIALDLSRATFIDSSALAMLVGSAQELERRGGCLVVACAHGAVRRVFELTHTTHALRLADTRDEAIAGCRDVRAELRAPRSARAARLRARLPSRGGASA
jgi:anti-anti-sigma factor